LRFEELAAGWNWRRIPGCPGRYSLSPAEFSGEPRALVGTEHLIREYSSSRARDTVWIAQVEGGGLISYRKQDGTFIHTLNTPEGFRRKLKDLDINLDGESAD